MKSTGKTHWERFYAAVASGDDEQAEALIPLLSPSDEPRLLGIVLRGGESRWWGVRGLAAVGRSAAISAVVACLQDPDAAVRAGAALALGQLFSRQPEETAPFLPFLAPLLADDDGLVRQTAGDSLAQCGDAAVDTLADALNSPHEGVRVRAAAALHRIGSMATAAPLYHHLEDPNPLVRHYAFETLDKLGLLTNVLLMRE
ncbi:MAG: HEAT repeat domain-containing protein [Caldilineaceae bacterium]|nr:HEAT repeat domain-containing protein [Caldilineaceae bacterium]HRJ40652.1 HEAT repeat domain-containing protein [Caldilineaceae bacterium]